MGLQAQPQVQVSRRYPAGIRLEAAGAMAGIRAGIRQYPGEYRAAPACQYRSIAGPLRAGRPPSQGPMHSQGAGPFGDPGTFR